MKTKVILHFNNRPYPREYEINSNIVLPKIGEVINLFKGEQLSGRVTDIVHTFEISSNIQMIGIYMEYTE